MSRHFWIVHVAVVALLAGTQLGFALERFSLWHRIAAVAIGLACYAVIVHDFRASRRRSRMPFLAMAATYYFVYFGLSTLWRDSVGTISGVISLSDEAILLAQFAVLVSLGSFVLGYRGGHVLGRRVTGSVARLVPGEEPGRGSFSVVALALGASCALLAATTLGRVELSPALQFLLGMLFAPQLPLLLTAWRSERMERVADKVLLVVGVLVVAFIGLLAGSLGQTLLPFLVPVLARLVFRGRIAWSWIAAAFAAFLVLQPAKFIYREAVWGDVHGRGASVSLEDRLAIWSDAVGESVEGAQTSGAPSSGEGGFVRRSMERTAELLFIAQAIEWVPAKVDFTYGRQLWAAIVSWIPRFAWPEKPNATYESNGRYALEFRLQNREGVRRSVANVGQIVEGYWALGWFGVVAAALIFGGLIGWLAGALPVQGWGTFAMGGFLLLTTAYHSSVANFVSGLPQRLAGGVVWCWLIAVAVAAVGSAGRAVRLR